MSSTYFNSDQMTMIDRLLAEVSPGCSDRSSTAVTSQARLLVSAFERGLVTESVLRQVLTDYIRLNDTAAPDPSDKDDELPSPVHSRLSGDGMTPPIVLNPSALDAGIRAFKACVGAYSPYRPDLHVADDEQLSDGLQHGIRAYLGALPSSVLVARLRRQADREVQGTVRHIVDSDLLMRAAAERISCLEAEFNMERLRPMKHDSVSKDVRAAIATFLDSCQAEAQPFATTEALGAIRAIFPDLDVSDAVLQDAISSAATIAGFEIDYDSRDAGHTLKRKALERWENEGGAVRS